MIEKMYLRKRPHFPTHRRATVLGPPQSGVQAYRVTQDIYCRI